MREVDASQAQLDFEFLLDLVETGEEIAITRDGKTVARLRSAKSAFDRDAARKAARDITEMARGLTLGVI